MIAEIIRDFKVSRYYDVRTRDNQEVWHLEVAGSPYIFSMKHASDNARKSMNLELITLVAVLRDPLYG